MWKFIAELGVLFFILGNAAVFGGFVHQRLEKSKNITTGMFQGAFVALGGFLLTMLAGNRLGADPSTQTWVLLVLLLIGAALAWFYRKDRKSQPLIWFLAGLIAAATPAIMFIWHIN